MIGPRTCPRGPEYVKRFDWLKKYVVSNPGVFWTLEFRNENQKMARGSWLESIHEPWRKGGFSDPVDRKTAPVDEKAAPVFDGKTRVGVSQGCLWENTVKT